MSKSDRTKTLQQITDVERIKLAFLAPDIIKAILRGDVPRDLSLDRLKSGFPLDWDEQRKILGFSQ